jgi:hypothetical protein
MTDEYIDDINDDEDAPIKINFTGVEGQRSFHLLPRGKYIAAVTDYTKSTVSDGATNAGEAMINWEFTIESTYPGLETEVTAKVRNQEPGSKTVKVTEEEIKVEGRRIYDNMVIIKSSYWRMKAFLEAQWFDASGEIEIFPTDIVETGVRMILDVGLQKSKKNATTGEVYRERNVIRAFHPHPDEKPVQVEAEAEATPSTVTAEAPVEDEKKIKTSKAKAQPEGEEAKV